MNLEQRARRDAAAHLAIARRHRGRHEEPYMIVRRAHRSLAIAAAGHLADALRGGDRDEYDNARECAEIAALAADMLRERYERILKARIAARAWEAS